MIFIIPSSLGMEYSLFLFSVSCPVVFLIIVFQVMHPPGIRNSCILPELETRAAAKIAAKAEAAANEPV
jgi:hypothetical protein